jgi:hypothetical protein
MPARKIENAIQLNDLLMNLFVTVLAVVMEAIVLIDYRRS